MTMKEIEQAMILYMRVIEIEEKIAAEQQKNK